MPKETPNESKKICPYCSRDFDPKGYGRHVNSCPKKAQLAHAVKAETFRLQQTLERSKSSRPHPLESSTNLVQQSLLLTRGTSRRSPANLKLPGKTQLSMQQNLSQESCRKMDLVLQVSNR